MYQRLRLWFRNNQGWVLSTKYIVYSVMLLILVSLIDLRVLDIERFIPDFFFMSVDLSKALLTTLASAMLTITTFTFSTVLTVLTTYSSSYSPRIIGNFANKKITMQVLGIFVGGFFYCITSLFTMRNSFFEADGVIAGSVGILYAISCMVYFVLFVHQVIYSIRPVNVISEIYEEALKVIRGEVAKREESIAWATEEYSHTYSIYADSTGYLSVIDTERLIVLLEEVEGTLTIEQCIGNYVVQGFQLAKLYTHTTIEEDTLSELATAFLYQEEKFEEEDYRYSITKLVEIALRAISPGINDPNTAIHCLNKIAILLGRLFTCDYAYIVRHDGEHMNIVYKGYSIYDDLYATYHQIVHYGKNDPSVMGALLEGLVMTYMMASEKPRETILTYYKSVYEIALANATDASAKRHFESINQRFRHLDADIVNTDVMEEE
ncbi:DUF2254 domain-containing protein [Aerococcaceae bacterium NML160702]|nr:DUF2254 domain-containing protein [Aerococcaceae bacterium NML160702]